MATVPPNLPRSSNPTPTDVPQGAHRTILMQNFSEPPPVSVGKKWKIEFYRRMAALASNYVVDVNETIPDRPDPSHPNNSIETKTDHLTRKIQVWPHGTIAALAAGATPSKLQQILNDPTLSPEARKALENLQAAVGQLPQEQISRFEELYNGVPSNLTFNSKFELIHNPTDPNAMTDAVHQFSTFQTPEDRQTATSQMQ